MSQVWPEGSPDDRPRRAGERIGEALVRTRRSLPHWQLGGSTCFLTYRCAHGRRLDAPDRDLVLDNWKHWDRKRYLLHAAVVMPDHVHILMTPLRRTAQTWFPLAEILQTNKGYSAHQVNRRAGLVGPLWQKERYDRLVRDESEFWEKWAYMTANPVEARLCRQAEEHAWWYGNSSAGDDEAHIADRDVCG